MECAIADKNYFLLFGYHHVVATVDAAGAAGSPGMLIHTPSLLPGSGPHNLGLRQNRAAAQSSIVQISQIFANRRELAFRHAIEAGSIARDQTRQTAAASCSERCCIADSSHRSEALTALLS